MKQEKAGHNILESVLFIGMRYCGREFTAQEVSLIREIAARPGMTRFLLSKDLCQALDWRKANGGLKDMSCRVALLRMHTDGLIELPVSRRLTTNRACKIERTSATDPGTTIERPAGDLTGIYLDPVVSKGDSRLWNELIDRYHYLGYKPLPGAQLRYFAKCDQGLLALFGFGAAAWKTSPRDKFIGWTPDQQQANLHLIVNNARFLILPWVRSRHLASKLLGLVARRIGDDWHHRYSYRPVMLETFVEKDRFRGTCYRAANWIFLGHTQGRGKLDRMHEHSIPIKSVWALPLAPNFRHSLIG